MDNDRAGLYLDSQTPGMAVSFEKYTDVLLSNGSPALYILEYDLTPFGI